MYHCADKYYRPQVEFMRSLVGRFPSFAATYGIYNFERPPKCLSHIRLNEQDIVQYHDAAVDLFF